MTAQGSPTTRLRRAIKGGSLAAVDLALIDAPQIDLQDALEVVALMAEAGDPRFARWAERWAERAALEDHSRTRELLRRLPLEVLRERAEQLRTAHPAARLMVRRGATGTPAAGELSESLLAAGEEVPRRGAGPRSRPPMPRSDFGGSFLFRGMELLTIAPPAEASAGGLYAAESVGGRHWAFVGGSARSFVGESGVPGQCSAARFLGAWLTTYTLSRGLLLFPWPANERPRPPKLLRGTRCPGLLGGLS